MTPEQKVIHRKLTERLEKLKCEESLADFIRGAWDILEPGTELVWNWHLDTMCAYLEALHYGRMNKLIINIPPGMMKSLVVGVFFPAWIWTKDPSYRFLCGSNEGTLATRDALKMRQVVESEWFQGHWPEVKLSKEQGEKTLYATTMRGHRESQGIRAKITGKRASMLILDDLHDASEAESNVIRENVLERYDSTWSSRRNNLGIDPIVLIMQRLHFGDITAHLLAKKQNWTHLAIPMRFDPELTFNAGEDIGQPQFNDPRKTEGELMFPERFPEHAVADLEEDLGPYGAAGQLQQRPSPKGGGEFKRDWLCFYKTRPRGGNRLIIVDPAGERKPGYVSKTAAKDNTAIGVFEYCSDGNIYLIDGVRDRLNLVERTDLLFKWHREYKPLGVYYERYGMQTDIAHINDIMERENYRFRITEVAGPTNKNDRIRRLQPWFERGRLWLPETLHRTNVDGIVKDIIDDFIEIEYLPFPVGKQDDFFDMMARLTDEDVKLIEPSKKEEIHLAFETWDQAVPGIM